MITLDHEVHALCETLSGGNGLGLEVMFWTQTGALLNENGLALVYHADKCLMALQSPNSHSLSQ